MRSKKRGTSLVEMMFAVGFIFLITGFVGNAVVECFRVQNITGAQYDMQRQGHHELDVMVDDIHDSQLILDSYTYNNVTYNSDNSSTIVLQTPSYDSTGNPLGTNDVIIYYLVGNAAPYTLYRIVSPAAGSARVAVDNQIIANVDTLTLTYYCDDDIIGDGITQTFTLAGVPTATPTVIKNGSNLAGSQMTFTAPQTLSFASPPAAPDALDIIYTVAPSVSPSQVSTVNIDVQLQQVSMAFQQAAETQTVELACRTGLRNH